MNFQYVISEDEGGDRQSQQVLLQAPGKKEASWHQVIPLIGILISPDLGKMNL